MINSKENKLLTTVALLKLINDSVKPEANVHFDPVGLPIKSNWRAKNLQIKGGEVLTPSCSFGFFYHQ